MLSLMQEKSAVFKESKALARSHVGAQLMAVTIELFDKCTNEITRCCEAWVMGENVINKSELWSTALQNVIGRMGPVQPLFSLAAAKLEQEAFQHTAELAIFAANALRKEVSAPASSIELLQAPSSASWPARAFCNLCLGLPEVGGLAQVEGLSLQVGGGEFS